MQRRLNERPEHPLHDHLYPLMEALKAFHGAVLQASIPWTAQMHHQVLSWPQTTTCRGFLMHQDPILFPFTTMMCAMHLTVHGRSCQG